MRQIRTFVDERVGRYCAYCAAAPDTRDHVPSRVLLDEPYPASLPVVPCCKACNAGFSADEQYVACLIECVIAGTTEPKGLTRAKIQRALKARPTLKQRIEQSRVDGADGPVWVPETAAVEAVLLKLARGHAAFDLGEPQYSDPIEVAFAPLIDLHPEVRRAFEEPPATGIWPEVGSRAMVLMTETLWAPDWIDVQPGRYRYLATVGEGIVVRIVLSEYLAGEVRWS